VSESDTLLESVCIVRAGENWSNGGSDLIGSDRSRELHGEIQNAAVVVSDSTTAHSCRPLRPVNLEGLDRGMCTGWNVWTLATT